MRVSVVCPVFNTRPDDLRAAVASALAELEAEGGEILLVDDHSTSEETKAALDELARLESVRLLRTDTNGGAARARNLGLSEARSDWVGFLDADDLWPEGKLDRARAALAARPATAWIFGDNASINQQNFLEHIPVSPELLQQTGEEAPEVVCAPALTHWILLTGLSLGTCLIRREQLGEDRRFAPEVVYGEDLVFLAKLSVAACATYAAGPAYTFRRQRTSLMWSARRLTRDYASGPRAAMRDAELRPYRRFCRWWLYGVLKDLAANNLVNGRRRLGLGFALQALWVDPREVGEFISFLRLLGLSGAPDMADRARRYSRREIVQLDQIERGNPAS